MGNVSNSALEQAKNSIIEAGKRLWRRGYLAGTDGNISVRLDDGHILVTGSGVAKGRLKADDILLVDSEGNPIDSAHSPSSELDMHLTVYRSRPDVCACVHSHAPHATAFALTGIEPPPDTLPEVVAFVGAIRLTAYAPPGTPAVGESLMPHLTDTNAFLLANHGLLTVGASLEQAYNRHEVVEQYCKIISIAKTHGPLNQLDPAEVARLKKQPTDESSPVKM